MVAASLLALDGADTIGGSKLILKYDESQVLLDFGTSFKKFGAYYEEYLNRKVVLPVTGERVEIGWDR